MSQNEANQADAQKDLARADKTRVSPLKGRPSPLKGRKFPRGNKPGFGSSKAENVVVISTKRTVYVDEAGNKLPDVGPDLMAPVVMVGSKMVEAMGMRPFDDADQRHLSEAWAPVAHKYAGWIMPYSVELVAIGALLMVMWPRVRELEAKKRFERELVNKKAAERAAAEQRAKHDGVAVN